MICRLENDQNSNRKVKLLAEVYGGLFVLEIRIGQSASDASVAEIDEFENAAI